MLQSSLLAAQSVADYSRRAVDTLRYREVTTAQTWLRLPQDTLLIPSLHDATIAVTFPHPDTAIAWYEALVLEVQPPSGRIRPATDSALRLPFVLLFDPRGRVTTLSAPHFPAAFEGVSDLTKQFHEFFPRLPGTPLAAGFTWTDTVARADSGAGKYFRSRIVEEHEVGGDTLVAGRHLVVIRSRQHINYESGGPVPGQPLRSDIRSSGDATQIVLFDTSAGAFFSKRRTGTLSGMVSYVGGQQPLSFPYRYSYVNAVELQ